MRCVTPTRRDNENAFVSLNGELCWRQTGILGTRGTQECGGGFKEERFPVTGCSVTLDADMPLTVRVWTNLNGDARDESFAIDNVVIEAGYPGGGICVSKDWHESSYLQARINIYTYHAQMHIHIQMHMHMHTHLHMHMHMRMHMQMHMHIYMRMHMHIHMHVHMHMHMHIQT